jgi:ribosomal protein L11 methyltransferase
VTWTEVKAIFDEPPLDWSIYVYIFEKHGCDNTLQEDSPPSISSAVVDVSVTGDVIRALSEDLMKVGASRVETRSLVDENWEENWKQFFHPRAIGDRFMIRPTWEEAPHSDRLEIVLDPGQAFGTGDHPTTRMCLQLMETAWTSLPVTSDPPKVADIGCGSGILSIGACLLGSKSVVAVDIEPLSVEVARENAALNKVNFECLVGQGIAAVADRGPFDVVISNIISAILIQIARGVAEALKPGGFWIVSGIIVQNWPDVLEAAQDAGFTLDSMLEEDGWVAGTLTRRTIKHPV